MEELRSKIKSKCNLHFLRTEKLIELKRGARKFEETCLPKLCYMLKNVFQRKQFFSENFLLHASRAPRHLGGSHHFWEEQALVADLLKSVDAERIRSDLRHLSRLPHLAGSKRDAELARWVNPRKPSNDSLSHDDYSKNNATAKR